MPPHAGLFAGPEVVEHVLAVAGVLGEQDVVVNLDEELHDARVHPDVIRQRLPLLLTAGLVGQLDVPLGVRVAGVVLEDRRGRRGFEVVRPDLELAGPAETFAADRLGGVLRPRRSLAVARDQRAVVQPELELLGVELLDAGDRGGLLDGAAEAALHAAELDDAAAADDVPGRRQQAAFLGLDVEGDEVPGAGADVGVEPVAGHRDAAVELAAVGVGRAEGLPALRLVRLGVESVGDEAALVPGPAHAVDHPVGPEHALTVDHVVAERLDAVDEAIPHQLLRGVHQRDHQVRRRHTRMQPHGQVHVIGNERHLFDRHSKVVLHLPPTQGGLLAFGPAEDACPPPRGQHEMEAQNRHGVLSAQAFFVGWSEGIAPSEHRRSCTRRIPICSPC